MKLRNKKTGETVYVDFQTWHAATRWTGNWNGALNNEIVRGRECS